MTGPTRLYILAPRIEINLILKGNFSNLGYLLKLCPLESVMNHSQQNAEYFFLWYKINRDTNLFERRGHQF